MAALIPALLRHRTLRLASSLMLHALWWAAAVASVIVALYSHGLAVGAYEVPCSGDGCVSLFQMTEQQFQDLRLIGLTPLVYGGLIVTLLTVQNLSALAIGILVYRYGWRDAYSVVASLIILVTGTIFSTDDTVLSPGLRQVFMVLNQYGSMYLFFFFLFPDGRFIPRWTVLPAVLWVIPMVSSFWLAPGTPLDLMTWSPIFKNAYMLVMHGLVIAVQIYRYKWASSPEHRRHIQWFIIGMSGYWLGGIFGLMTHHPSNGLVHMLTMVILYGGLLILPFSMGMAVLENRLRLMSIAFNRTIVYAVLTIMIVLVYALVVGVLGILLQGQVNIIIALMATGLIALLGQTIRDRVQRAVNHLVYGEREDPYSVLSSLGERLESALTHRSLLYAVAQNVANALHLPYAAIEVQTEGATAVLAAWGETVEPCSRIPLTVQGEEVGWLALGIVRPDDLLVPGKRRLLDDLVRQVSIAVQAVRLTEELHRSRERLVGAREEERRRLRRDLHDGLGSGLASMMLRLDQVIPLQETEPGKARQLLGEVQAQLRESIADIRRLVYALRPPALDEFGLLFALQELTLQFEESGLHITFDGPEWLSPQHAAVEVAIYRIVQEALTNVARHAQATQCRIRLRVDSDTVWLEVRDNGCGLPERLTPGIGIRSMRERAEELGGTCVIQSTPGEGTMVGVTLPIERGEWQYGEGRTGKVTDHAG